MDDRGFEFVPGVFFEVLAGTLTVVLLGRVGAVGLYGSWATEGAIDCLISAPIFAHVVHLLVVHARDREANGE